MAVAVVAAAAVAARAASSPPAAGSTVAKFLSCLFEATVGVVSLSLLQLTSLVCLN